MSVFYTDVFVLPLPETHQFPMSKYRRLRERLIAENVLKPSQIQIPPAATDEQLCLAHTPEYVARVSEGRLTKQELRRIGFPWSPEMVERLRRSTGATIEAARAALKWGLGINLAGGTHHAFADKGEGYCVFNDSLVAARVIQKETSIQKVLVLDLDVHQGNGTASIAAGDASIFTCSLHGAKNFPYRKESSDLDVPLPDGTTDADYLAALKMALAEVKRRFRPELVLYLAGADPYFEDRFGRLKLSEEGLRQRDMLVYDFCQAENVPLSIAMAGGYAANVEKIVSIHFSTVKLALEQFGMLSETAGSCSIDSIESVESQRTDERPT